VLLAGAPAAMTRYACAIVKEGRVHHKTILRRIDWHFVLALLAGPVVWMAGAVIWQPTTEWHWTLARLQQFMMVVVLYPVLEEVVFRGALQGWFREHHYGLRAWAGLSVANILTSLIFSAMHLWSHPPLWAAAVLIPSLVFGYFRDRYDDQALPLLAPVVLHIFYNAGWLLLFGYGG